jgi:hypothetical protein
MIPAGIEFLRLIQPSRNLLDAVCVARKWNVLAEMGLVVVDGWFLRSKPFCRTPTPAPTLKEQSGPCGC